MSEGVIAGPALAEPQTEARVVTCSRGGFLAGFLGGAAAAAQCHSTKHASPRSQAAGFN
jgi:hypothetical protein